MRGDVNVVKKAIEEAITNYWKLLDPKVFTTLAGSMVNRIEAIIKADGWYTKYQFLLCIYIFLLFFLIFIIMGLVGEAVVIAEDFRPLIPPLFWSPDNILIGFVSLLLFLFIYGRIEGLYTQYQKLFQLSHSRESTGRWR